MKSCWFDGPSRHHGAEPHSCGRCSCRCPSIRRSPRNPTASNYFLHFVLVYRNIQPEGELISFFANRPTSRYMLRYKHNCCFRMERFVVLMKHKFSGWGTPLARSGWSTPLPTRSGWEYIPSQVRMGILRSGQDGVPPRPGQVGVPSPNQVRMG